MTDYQEFLKLLIESTALYKIKNNEVVDVTTDETYTIANKKLVLPTQVIENINDLLIVNPFTETINRTSGQKWFYSTLSLSVAYKIKQLFYWVEKLSNGPELSSSATKLVAKYCKDMDDKTKKEIANVTRDLIQVATIYYSKRTKISYFKLSLFDVIAESSIRKVTKTWMIRLLKDVFNLKTSDVSDIKEVFAERSTKITFPKLDSFSRVYLNVMTYLNDVFDKIDAEEFLIDLEELGNHISNLDSYYKKLKWITQPDQPKVEKDNENTSYLDNILSPYKQPEVQPGQSQFYLPKPAELVQNPWGQSAQPIQQNPWGQSAQPIQQNPWGQPAQPIQQNPWGQPAQPIQQNPWGQPAQPIQQNPWGQPAQQQSLFGENQKSMFNR